MATAWANVATLWNGGGLTPDEVDDLLQALHRYFLFLGLDQYGFLSWRRIVCRLGQIKIREARPDDLASLLDDIRAAMQVGSRTSL